MIRPSLFLNHTQINLLDTNEQFHINSYDSYLHALQR